MGLKITEEIAEMIREEIPNFCNGDIISEIVAQNHGKTKSRYPVPTFSLEPPFIDGLGLRTKTSHNTVTYHRIPIKGLDFDVLHLLVFGHKEKEEKPFEVFRIQAAATIAGGLERSVIVRHIKLGILKHGNFFLPVPPPDHPIGKSYEKMFSDIFKNKKYWHSSLEKLNNDEKLIKSINKLMTRVEVNSNYVVYSTTKTISFEDELVGVGCLVPNYVTNKGAFAVFQTVPEFVRHTVRRYQSLRLNHLTESINLSANIIKNNIVKNPDSTFWLESSVSTILKHLASIENEKALSL